MHGRDSLGTVAWLSALMAANQGNPTRSPGGSGGLVPTLVLLGAPLYLLLRRPGNRKTGDAVSS